MRCNIMLQLVGFIALVLLVTAALFAWLQTRPNSGQNTEWEISQNTLY